MDRILEYTQTSTNFDSVYNVSSHVLHQPNKPVSFFTSADFSKSSRQSSAPLFRRCTSPRPRRPILDEAGPKFNFDLYKMDDCKCDPDDDCSLSCCSLSPSRTRAAHFDSMYSPVSSPNSNSEMLSKLRQTNYDLLNTLASTELSSQRPVHYHIHHYPLSQHVSRQYCSRSASREPSSSTETNVSPNIHKAPVTYRVHDSRRPHRFSHHWTTFDGNPTNKQTVIDLYPSRDHSFTKQKRMCSNDQSIWLVHGTSIRRNSYSNDSATELIESSKGPYFGDKPIESHHRSVKYRERPTIVSRHKSPQVKCRARDQTIYLSASGRDQECNTSLTETSLPRRLDRSTKKNRSHDAGTTSVKSKRPLQDAKSSYKSDSNSGSESILSRTEHDISTGRHVVNKRAHERKPPSSRPKERHRDQHLNNSTGNSDNKENLVRPPVVAGKSEPVTQNSTPRENISVNRKSSNNESLKPDTESKSTRQLKPNESIDKSKTLLDNEPSTMHRSGKPESRRSTPRQGDSPTPQKDQTSRTEPRKPNADSNTPIHDSQAKPTQHGNPRSSPASETKSDQSDSDNQEATSHSKNLEPSSSSTTKIHTSERKTPPPLSTTTKQADNNDHQSVTKQDGNKSNGGASSGFDFSEWLKGASSDILGPSKESNNRSPVTSVSKPKPISAPRRKQQPPSPTGEDSESDLYNPPFGPKRNNKPTTDNPLPTVLPESTTTSTIKTQDDLLTDFFS